MSKKNPDSLKNWPLVKNPQFLSNPHETLSKWSTHEVNIFTKFHEDQTRIVDFLPMVNFWMCPFLSSDSILFTLLTSFHLFSRSSKMARICCCDSHVQAALVLGIGKFTLYLIIRKHLLVWWGLWNFIVRQVCKYWKCS